MAYSQNEFNKKMIIGCYQHHLDVVEQLRRKLGLRSSAETIRHLVAKAAQEHGITVPKEQ